MSEKSTPEEEKTLKELLEAVAKKIIKSENKKEIVEELIKLAQQNRMSSDDTADKLVDIFERLPIKKTKDSC